MYRNKAFTATAALALLVMAGTTAVRLPGQKDRNLKVLPKDISDAKLDSIMHSYNRALGVNCRFCHAPGYVFPDTLDYASDKEPMKENARNMMRMVIDINKKNFWFDTNTPPVYLKVVTCRTCHRGEEIPPEDK